MGAMAPCVEVDGVIRGVKWSCDEEGGIAFETRLCVGRDAVESRNTGVQGCRGETLSF
jgi:hypothetical protein